MHKVDFYAGAIIQRLRTRAGMSQTVLGERIGVSTQQIQKYEKGENRISVGRLFDIAATLETTPCVIIKLIQHQMKIDKEII